MARKRRSVVPRRRRSYSPRRSRSRSRGFGGRLFNTLVAALISVPVISWILAKVGVIPAQYFLPASLVGSGMALYLVDGKSTGVALMGAGLGMAALPYVLSFGQTSQPSGQVWV